MDTGTRIDNMNFFESLQQLRETQRPFAERPLKALETKEAHTNVILSRTGGHSSSRNQGNLGTLDSRSRISQAAFFCKR